MICPYCHQENRDDAKFCRHCGKQIGLYEDVSFDDSKKPEKQQVQPSVRSVASPQQSDNSKWIVIIVAIIAAAAVAIVACYFLFNVGKRSGKNVTKNTTHIIERQKDTNDNDEKNDSTVDADDDDDTYHGSDEFNAAALDSSTGYLMPDSSSEYFTRSEVSGLTSRELSLARNEIFARHHRTFSSPTLQDYFNNKSWYDGYIAPGDFDDSTLNSYERANVELLKDVESSKGWYIAP